MKFLVAPLILAFPMLLTAVELHSSPVAIFVGPTIEEIEEAQISLSGKTISYDLSDREYPWSLVIFNGIEPPRESDIVFDPALIRYLQKGL